MKKCLIISLLISIPVIIAQVYLNRAYHKEFEKSQQDEVPIAVGHKEATPTEQIATEPTYRFRVKSNNANFGAPLDYSAALSGDLKITGSNYAKAGILVDMSSRRVLWAKNPDKSLPIASMTKMMTLLIAFEKLETMPSVSLDTTIPISKAATRIGGSQIWLDTRETLSLETLFKAVAIKSANDAAYLLSEYFGGGDTATFVALMNDRAQELNMTGTRFVNAHGLIDSTTRSNSVSTPEDMVMLGERLTEYPKLMEWFGTPMDFFTYPFSQKKIELANHNKLIRPHYQGVDGIKTGFNDQSGYCLTVSCVRNGRRLMGCVMGFPSAKDKATGRDPFARKLLDWGYARAAELDRSHTSQQTVDPSTGTGVRNQLRR